MSELWRHVWRVTVGTLQSEAIDVAFKVVRSLRATPGTCELTVYNLTETHRRAAQAARRPLVRIEAGYASTGTSLLFQGNARHVTVERDGPDWLTKVTAGDGVYAIQTARAARSFGPDARVEEVARYLADAMGVGPGNVLAALRNARLDRLGDTFPQGTALHGYAERELTALLNASGLTWSVQHGVLQVLPRGRALATTAVRLAPSTGLVGSPSAGQHGVVKVKALLLPDLVPGRLVHVESAAFAGDYRIERAEYTGDTRGGDWTANLDVRRVAR